ncbi:hypothetical protein [Cryptosporangium sp. NPDC051539]|uniref:hypothetical protein n=1 Tax=Cryptosporangium sp. NPDC051539 TaxID=3363962 RepID=UPI00378D7B29
MPDHLLGFTNKTANPINLIVGQLNSGGCGTDPFIQGWWTVQPGDLVFTLKSSSPHDRFFYAEDGAGNAWSGNGPWVDLFPKSFAGCASNGAPGAMKLVRMRPVDPEPIAILVALG